MIPATSLKKARDERYSGDTVFPFPHSDFIFSDCLCKICERGAAKYHSCRQNQKGKKDELREFIDNCNVMYQIGMESQLGPSRNLIPSLHPSQELPVPFFCPFFPLESMKLRVL